MLRWAIRATARTKISNVWDFCLKIDNFHFQYQNLRRLYKSILHGRCWVEPLVKLGQSPPSSMRQRSMESDRCQRWLHRNAGREPQDWNKTSSWKSDHKHEFIRQKTVGANLTWCKNIYFHLTYWNSNSQVFDKFGKGWDILNCKL